MAINNNLEDFFRSLAKTIRFKTNKSDSETIKPVDMAEVIKEIKLSEHGTFEAEVTCTVPSGTNNIETLVIGDAVSIINTGAYSSFKGLRRVKFMGDITSIYEKAFYDCSVLGLEKIGDTNIYNKEYVEFSDSIRYVGKDALYNTGWFNAQNPEDGVVYVGLCCYKYKNPTTPADVTIKDGTASISINAFNSSNIKSATIGKGIKTIYNAFSGCKNLTEIKVLNGFDDEGVNIVGGGYQNCTNLIEFYAQNVRATGGDGFYGCTSLKKVRFDKVTKIAQFFMRNNQSVEELHFGHCDEFEYASIYDVPNLKRIIILNEDHLPIYDKLALQIYNNTNVVFHVPASMVTTWQDSLLEKGFKNSVVEYKENE